MFKSAHSLVAFAVIAFAALTDAAVLRGTTDPAAQDLMTSTKHRTLAVAANKVANLAAARAERANLKTQKLAHELGGLVRTD